MKELTKKVLNDVWQPGNIREGEVFTRDSNFDPWRSEAEHTTSWSRKLSTILNPHTQEQKHIASPFSPDYIAIVCHPWAPIALSPWFLS